MRYNYVTHGKPPQKMFLFTSSLLPTHPFPPNHIPTGNKTFLLLIKSNKVPVPPFPERWLSALIKYRAIGPQHSSPCFVICQVLDHYLAFCSPCTNRFIKPWWAAFSLVATNCAGLIYTKNEKVLLFSNTHLNILSVCYLFI